MDLNVKLEELEIDSSNAQKSLICDANASHCNPFYENVGDQVEISSEISKKREQIFGSCRCRNNNNSKNLLGTSSISSNRFKPRKKRGILKEPMLKEVAKSCICKLSHHKKDVTSISDELLNRLTLHAKDDSDGVTTFKDFHTLADTHASNAAAAAAAISSTSSQSDDELYSRQSFKNLRSKMHRKVRRIPKVLEPSGNLVAGAEGGSGVGAGEGTSAGSNGGATCSMQARVSPNQLECDVTINEIASYFELLYIPKKMSSEVLTMFYS